MPRHLEINQYGSNLGPQPLDLGSPNDRLAISISSSSSNPSSILSSMDFSFEEANRERNSPELIDAIGSELQRRMDTVDIYLPPDISMQDFITDYVLGEPNAGALDPVFLQLVLADLRQPDLILSWWWEVAFDYLSLVGA